MISPHRHDTPELIDGPGIAPGELAENLRDMQQVNRWVGGYWLSIWALRQFVQSIQSAHTSQSSHFVHPQRMLVADVGCGIGDFGPHLVAQGYRVVACDINPQIVRLAASSQGGRGIAYVAADGLRLPLPDAAVDVVHCSFTLHHFAPEQAVALLRELGRVARGGVIINDLSRSWVGIAGAWLLGRLLSRNRLTRHDGLASAWRAYTAAELGALAEQAGLVRVAQRKIAGYRMVAVFRAAEAWKDSEKTRSESHSSFIERA